MASVTVDNGGDEPAASEGIAQCKVAAFTSIGLLGPAHALFQGSTDSAALAVLVLLIGTQAFAIFSIVSALFVAWKLKKLAHPEPFVMRTPITCCCVAGTLLVVATCVIHWKAGGAIVVLAGVLLIVAYRESVRGFGGWLAYCCINAITGLRAPRAANRDLEMGPAGNNTEAGNGVEAEPGLNV
ncbi:hypothetical protein AURDEDRAFT_165102 [Auricularia subglabra TFB-10046 SS5]|nr:hypothetical protein AURDEDRAFT_165102 [Auricularia subglabra TFB-10046 SS5]